MSLTLLPDCRRPKRLIAGAMLAAVLGCGDGSPSTGSRSPQSADASGGSEFRGSEGRTSETPTSDPPISELRSRTKWIGDIPYDVFFDDPLAVAAESQPVDASGGSDRPEVGAAEVEIGGRRSERRRVRNWSVPTSDPPTAETPTLRDSDPQSLPAPANPVTSPVEWQQLADIEVLSDEVKQLRNRLTANLRTVATYNRNLDAVHNDAIILAAIAAVVAIHPGSLSWQEKAGAIRDLARAMASRAGETGREAFSRTQIAFDQLVVILDGGIPPGDDAPADIPFSDVAERSELMKRIKRSFDWLKAEINTESRFRESAGEAARQAALLAVLGGIVSTESYGSADEPQYQQYVLDFIAGNTGMKAAAAAGRGSGGWAHGWGSPIRWGSRPARRWGARRRRWPAGVGPPGR